MKNETVCHKKQKGTTFALPLRQKNIRNYTL